VLLEPNPAYQKDLNSLVGDQVTHVAAAAGRTSGTLPLLLPDEPGGASFLPSSGEGGFFKGSVDVPVIPLDQIDLGGTAHLVKLDVQGYELEALAGAERVMEEAEVLVLECSLHPFQERIPLIHEVVAYLTERGFRLYDYGDEVRWSSGTLAQLDLIFTTADSPLLAPVHWH
jgi:FkbM family methyltransferase